jgi:Glycosyltransferase 61
MTETTDDRSFAQSFEVVRGGFATPHRLTGPPGRITGCIYRADGTKVMISERFGGFMGDLVISDNPDQVNLQPDAARLSGRAIYLGHHMGGHYGHFITEGLSTFWALEEHPAETFDHFVLHPFTFGEAVPPYMRYCLDCFGIPADRVVLVHSDPLVFDEIVVPERLFRLNHSGDPRLRWVYQRIAQSANIERPMPRAIYLSRRKFANSILDRVVANEVQIEHAFARRGFTVIFPETMSFEEQTALYAATETMAGFSGSGLHNSVFMQPSAHVIELGDPRYEGHPAPSQALCNHISGVRSSFIPFRGWRFGARETILFSTSGIERGLDQALGPMQTVGASRAMARTRLSDLFRIAYRAVRPSVGLWIRKVIPRSR